MGFKYLNFQKFQVSINTLQISINERSYCQRRDNILLVGLWIVAKKSDINLYLKLFINELKDLHENRFECLLPDFKEPIKIKVHTILPPVDLVEWYALQNIHQWSMRLLFLIKSRGAC